MTFPLPRSGLRRNEIRCVLTASPSSVSGAAVTFPEKKPFSIGWHPASNLPCATEWFEGRKPVGAKWNSSMSPTSAVTEFGLKTKVSGSVRSWMARIWMVDCPRAWAAKVAKTRIEAGDIMVSRVIGKRGYLKRRWYINANDKEEKEPDYQHPGNYVNTERKKIRRQYAASPGSIAQRKGQK